MKKARVKLIEFSPVCEDGSRKTVNEKVLATCSERGTAELIAMYLRKGAYKTLLSATGENEHVYTLCVG